MESGAPSTHYYLYNSYTHSSAKAYFTHRYPPKIGQSMKKQRNTARHINLNKMDDNKDHESSLIRVTRICNTLNERMQKQKLNRPRRPSLIPAKYLLKKVQKVDQQESAANLYRWWLPTNNSAECVEDDVQVENIQKHQYNYPRWYDNESFLSVQGENFGAHVTESECICCCAANFIMGQF